MTTITVKAERAELLTFHELDEEIRAEFDYIEPDESYSPQFFSFTMGTGDDEHVEWYDLGEFMASTSPEFANWDGFHADTFFSAVLVKILTGDDEGFLKVAFAYS